MIFQRGGTLLGFILGLVVGLGIALGVALYVTKVPLPFMNKGQTRSPDQNEAEAKKNKDWDPNALITGKPAAKASPPSDATAPVAPAIAPPVTAPVAAPAVTAPAPAVMPTPAAPATAAQAAAAKTPAPAPASAASAAPQTNYFVQVGAFRSSDDAQGQRAKLALNGIDAVVTERDQGGRPIYRVRVGPFEKIEDAERAKEKLDKTGTDTVLVKVQR
ncbi:MAG: SPOR domain-containing protein [Betaproteobacteria bacterium]